MIPILIILIIIICVNQNNYCICFDNFLAVISKNIVYIF